MNLLSYLIISELSLIGFYLIWRFVLLRSDAHKANRWWLLAGMLVAAFFPMISLSGTITPELTPHIQLPEVFIDMKGRNSAHIVTESFNWFLPIYLLYALGVGISFVRVLASLRKINKIQKNSRQIDNGVYVIKSAKQEAFSFMKWIFLPENVDAGTRNCLLLHESVHTRELHTVDILLVGIWKSLHWFSPMGKLYENAIKNTHEFIVDAEILTHHIDKELYAKTLIRAHQSELQIGLVHSFSDKSSIKNRLKMMYKTKSKTGKLLQLLAVPFFIATVLIACTKVEGRTEADRAQQEVLKVAEVMPEFPGGKDAFMQYMMEHIKYPESEKAAGASGKVFVSFVIGKNGEVRDAQIKRSMGDAFDQAALQVVADMPHWTPGKQDGKNVAVEMTLPINYVMDSE